MTGFEHVSALEGGEAAERKKAEEEEEPEREPSALLLVLLCAVSALEGADTQLLPSAMKALQTDINFKLTDIAYLTVAQAVCTNLAAPFWGILADRGILRRKSILMIGALGQGIITTTLAFSVQLWPMIILRACEGAMLAALRPISNGIIADLTSETKRGKIFGRVQSSLLMGMFVSSMVVVNMANRVLFGIQGWRVSFVLIGLIAAGVAGTVGLCMDEPPRDERENPRKGCGAVAEELGELVAFARIPTFLVLVVQGVFGTIPWSVMGNMVLFFQLCGIDDMHTSLLSAEFTIAGAIGNLVAGCVSDGLARRMGMHGRPCNAQITVICGIPMIYMLFFGIMPGDGSFLVYFLLIAGFGIFGSWAQSGTNFPILSDIVPASSRSRIMSWECALEHSIANAVGPPVVALLATRCFGYKFGAEEAKGVSLGSARALGQAMTAVVCLPWLVCLAGYTSLHWTYPRDVLRLRAEAAAAKAAQLASKEAATTENETGSDSDDAVESTEGETGAALLCCGTAQ